MKPLRIPHSSLSCLALGLLSLSCQSGPSTSSSSNWVLCEHVADCATAEDAVDCVDGYCVDQAGERVEQSDSGSGGGASSGGASSGDGGASASGAAPGSGGENLGGAGSGSGGTEAGTGGVGELSCQDFEQLAACSEDQDCMTGERTVDCCGSRAVTGVSVAQEDAFAELAASCDAAYPACGCAASAYPTADDGRWLTAGEAGVSCFEGVCRSWVGERACGDALTCAPGEICLLSTIVVGPTETETYSCADNPCSPAEALDCACAAPSCDLGDGRSRLCALSVSEAYDVLCQDQAQ